MTIDWKQIFCFATKPRQAAATQPKSVAQPATPAVKQPTPVAQQTTPVVKQPTTQPKPKVEDLFAVARDPRWLEESLKQKG
jgi:hypothetical protein